MMFCCLICIFGFGFVLVLFCFGLSAQEYHSR